ncbi:glutathione peroxidase [Sphingosinicella microcystinivorans]|uniref:glutathione peroxidase n=1 Tax=Sphingosinicella microcystinivorans TaxID=335406 RepID=UPI0022F3C0CB|nr:glutathione peroxidase [Sphingosinicella microcystinivorans]WBX85833.1 glutathione peroxidase [Sphingosinicella microcystinivorans]
MTTISEIPLKTIDGSAATLGDYAGKVLLVVNVASKCGLTPQYDGLEALYADRKDAGLVVLGFPANDFAGQEPGTDSEIADFCRSTFGVDFPMFSKIAVTGADRHPLYDALVEARPQATQKPGGDLRAKLETHGLAPADPTGVMWNFEKFLIGRDGQVIGRFAPDVAPDDPALVEAIDAALAA